MVHCCSVSVCRDSNEKLNVTEVMGEGRYSFSIPMQLL